MVSAPRLSTRRSSSRSMPRQFCARGAPRASSSALKTIRSWEGLGRRWPKRSRKRASACRCAGSASTTCLPSPEAGSTCSRSMDWGFAISCKQHGRISARAVRPPRSRRSSPYREVMRRFDGLISRRTVTKAGLMCIAAVAGAGVALAQQRLRIAFANFNDEASFGTLVLRGMREAAKKRPDLDVAFYDNKADVTRAVENARLVATTKPSAFIEYSSVSAAANPQIARIVKAAGLPTISVQSRVPDTQLFAVDNELAGY